MSEPELILHHYAGSPFGEKIRRILAFKGLDWCSVEIPPTLPRPHLSPLTGAHRRTPVLQVGAHVYCDTRCIAAFVERRSPEPTLFPEGSRFASELLASWAEPRMFVAMAPLRFRRAEDVGGLFEDGVDVAAFVADRTPFMKGALDVARIGELLPAACDQVRAFLRVLDGALGRVGGGPYLAGSKPSLADFSAYHLVWWLDRRPRIGEVLDRHPRVGDWMRRIASLGCDRGRSIDAGEALDCARRHQPEVEVSPALDDGLTGRALGGIVRVSADDYGRDAVSGEMVSSTIDEIVLRREHPAVGTVLLHFPRIGFEILPEKAAV
jgi:glutathione S-transferase